MTLIQVIQYYEAHITSRVILQCLDLLLNRGHGAACSWSKAGRVDGCGSPG